MTLTELINTSVWYAIRVSVQDRSRNTFEKSAAPAATPKRETYEALHARAMAMVEQPTRVTVNEGGLTRSVERLVPMPAFQAAGYETAQQYITEISEKQLRESQAAVTVTPAVQRVVDSWGTAKPFASIAPGAKMNLPMDEAKRFVIEIDDPEQVTLQIQNQSATRTLRLRNRTESGEVHRAFVAPAQVAIVTAGKSVGAIVELLST